MCPIFRKLAFLLFLAVVPIAGCGFRSSHPVKIRTSTATLQEASLEQLVANINASAEKLQTLKATVDIDSSFLDPKKDQVKDNPQVAGYVLVRKPEMLRMRILVPVVRNVMIDMVSNGSTFSLAIPPRSKFYVGSDQQPAEPSPKPLENLRPQHIADSLLLKPVTGKEIAVLENTTEIVKDPKSHKDVEQSAYALVVIDKDDAGYFLSRKIIISRTDLLPHEQHIYDRQGRLVTYAHYENYSDYSGVTFPGIVSIQRPIEGFGLTLSIVKLDVNVQVTDEQFVLAQPAGSQVIDLNKKDLNPKSSAAVQDGDKKKPH